MYGYYEYSDILPEQLLQKIPQEKIFEWLLNVPSISLDEKYLAPYRIDHKPRCWFEYRDRILMFMDFGDRTGNRHKSCFGLTIAVYNVTLRGAIDLICQQFGLSRNSVDYKPVERPTIEKQEKKKAIIIPEIKEYDRRDKLYWSQYLIKVEHLEEDKVHSVKKYFLDSNRGKRWIYPYSHCYDIDFIDAHKLYQPYNLPVYRWISNCDEDHIGNFNNLPAFGDRLVIQKSYKDHRTLRNILPEYNNLTIWLQNEGCVPSLYIVKNLVSRFAEILIMFDNDEAGILAGIKLSEIFNSFRDNCCRLVVLPTIYQKNISDLAHKEGRADTIKILKQIKL